MDEKTSIALVNEDGSYTITIPHVGINMETMINELIVPLLLAAGYNTSSIESYIEQW